MAAKSISKNFLKTAFCRIIPNTLLAGAVYIASLAGLQLWAESRAPKIKSDSELVAMLGQEKGKLGCSKNIAASIDYGNGSSQSRKVGENKYQIVLNKNDADLAVLRHELYHIHAGHAELQPTFFRYWFLGEPSAILYSAFGK